MQSAWYRRSDADERAIIEPSPVPDTTEDDPVAFRDNVAAPPPTQTRLRDPVAESWERLAQGPDPTAFAELLAAAEADPERADLSLRLYWLLAFHPSLDRARDRHHWLARALRQSRFQGPALELYR